MLEPLIDKIKKKEISIGVIGLGRVGLPLATMFAIRGVNVVGIDINQERLNAIKNSQCPFYDMPVQEGLEKANKLNTLSVSKSLEQFKDPIDIIFVTVGTPTTNDNRVDYSQLFAALNDISKKDIKNKIIILRSTLPPKTTSDIVIPFLENKTSLKVGLDFGIAMCPERILEGQAMKELHELPEIIGGTNDTTNQIITELFKIINPEKEFLYTSPVGAELAKLFNNIYRYISFALSNELAIWAENFGQDAGELIRIANYNYPRGKIPIPGFVGGPCLSKDGIFLDSNTTFSSIISTAWKLNEAIPQHIVNNIKKMAGNLVGKKIAVLGLSFKAGSDDTRNSPSVKLVEILKDTGAKVSVHDPHVKNTLSLSDALESQEIIIIATNHKEFRELIPNIKNSGAEIIFDVWSMFKNEDFENIKYLRFGDGANL